MGNLQILHESKRFSNNAKQITKMEISPLLIYLASLSTTLLIVAGVICAFTAFVYIVLFFILLDEPNNPDKVEGTMNKIKPIFLLSLAILVFTPSKTTIAEMIILPAVVNNEHVQNISENALKWADSYIQELVAKEKESKK